MYMGAGDVAASAECGYRRAGIARRMWQVQLLQWRAMRIALAQINPTVGDVAGNSRRIVDAIERAAAGAAELVAFPELAVLGYPPKDLLLKPDVLRQCEAAITYIAGRCRQTVAIVGYPCESDASTGRPLYNAAAVCGDGRVLARHVKSLLPTYDVFDESRYFEPGPVSDLTEVRGMKLGISICEDLWNDRELVDRQLYHDNPIEKLAARGAAMFINCSASPFVVGKHAFRMKLFRSAAKRHGLPLIYVNQVGGNDELIFDGNSCVVDARGEVVAQARDFAEDLVVVDVAIDGEGHGPTQSVVSQPRQGMAAVYEALVLGLGDYCRKCGFTSAVLGLSGGIDSAVCACIAAAALGSENVTGIAMPSRYSSAGSKSDAEMLAENLGVKYEVVPIAPAHDAMEAMVGPFFGDGPPGLAEENIQARLRGVLLMAYSNKFGSLLVTTGNKSEMAVGYCTLYGDMNGGLAILADVPKMMVYELAAWINTPACPLHAKFDKPVIPRNSITKPPSAELRPDQTDQDSLPAYEVLDQIVERYVEREQDWRTIVEATGFEAATVKRIVQLIDRNEYKRKQAAPVLKITGRAFGFGRRMPIAQRYDAGGSGVPAD
jgi:NAD+ synthase (glutamine-hydrolysing)